MPAPVRVASLETPAVTPDRLEFLELLELLDRH